MEKELLQQADIAISEMELLLSLFSTGAINKIPFAGSWTAAQVGEHMRMSIGGCAELMNGHAKPAGRDPEEQVPQLRATFLNFEQKMKSPDFVTPPAMEYDKEHLLAGLEYAKNEVKAALATKDATQLCTDFEFPFFGYMTRLELANFVIFHTRRHNEQLKRIYGVLTAA